jgi:hypothetical protein
MAQKSIDFSKFTRSNGTIQILMLWASFALHLMIGSSLGLFGRLEPIKVKPVGGTVKVVELTPAEQTRVPEAAKSRPLPIAPTPVNPEIATRTSSSPLPSRNPGVSAFVPPPNRPPLAPPASQVSTPQPIISTNPNSKKPELSADSRKKRSPQESDSENDQGNSEGDNRRRSKKEAQADKEEQAQTNSPESKKDIGDGPENARKDQQERDRIARNNRGKDPFDEEKKKIQDAISSFKQTGGNIIEVKVPKDLQDNSSCRNYKDIEMLWPIDEKGNLDLSTQGAEGQYTFEEILPDDKIPKLQRNQAKKIALETYGRQTLSQKKQIINEYKKDAVNKAHFIFRMSIC